MATILPLNSLSRSLLYLAFVGFLFDFFQARIFNGIKI